MKGSSHRILVVLLALALALSLAACEKDTAPDGGRDAEGLADLDDMPSPTQDPAGFLSYNAANTEALLSERYAGSPLVAIAKAAAPSGRFDLRIDPEDGSDEALEGSLVYDLETKELRLDASLASGKTSFSASAYIDPDFIGVSSEQLFGDGIFYGFTPYDLYGQVSGSAFASYMDSETVEALHILDSMLEELQKIEIPDRDTLKGQYEDSLREYIDAVDLTGRKTTVELDGKSLEGYSITADMDSEAMADIMERYYEAVVSAPVMEALSNIAAAYGEELDPDAMRAELDKSVDAIRESGVRARVEFVNAGGYLAGLSVSVMDSEGEELRATADLLSGDMISGEIASGGQTVRFISSVSSDGDGYDHTLTLTGQDGDAVKLITEWADDVLQMRFEGPEQEYMGLRAHLTADNEGFTLSNILLNENNVSTSLPLSVTYTPNTTVEAPGETVNLFDLTEDEIGAIALHVMMALSSFGE